MRLDCKNCGAMCGHWMVVEVPGHEGGEKGYFKCVCRQCGAIWHLDHHPLKEGGHSEGHEQSHGPEAAEAFGVDAPPDNYYLHPGHAWAVLEDEGVVRVGLDDFSQKVLGPASKFTLPKIGEHLKANEPFMSLSRQGKKAEVLAPLGGTIVAVNPKVRERPQLVHDDPYGEGWLFTVTPSNLKGDLEEMLFGQGPGIRPQAF